MCNVMFYLVFIVQQTVYPGTTITAYINGYSDSECISTVRLEIPEQIQVTPFGQYFYTDGEHGTLLRIQLTVSPKAESMKEYPIRLYVNDELKDTKVLYVACKSICNRTYLPGVFR